MPAATVSVGPVTVTYVHEDPAGGYALLEWEAPPGAASPPVHVHHRTDEGFYVLSGAFRFLVDGKTVDGPAGSHVLVRGGVPHTFWNAPMTAIVADVGTQTSACTGAKPRPGETWSNKFYGTIDASAAVWGIDFVIQNYGGPGTYDTRAIAVQLHSTDQAQVWQNTSASDKVVFTLDRSGQTGTIDALLTNADSGKASAEHLTGAWNCKA